MAEPGLPKEALDDPFRPPEEPCIARCLHCGQEYSSDQIFWDGEFWSCPVEGCGGAGYQFDIHPLDSPLWGGDEDEDENGEMPSNN